MTIHPEADLSAFLDDALDVPARAAVEAHLDTCAVCRAHLADLRAVSRLLAALPAPAPRRSLVPRLMAPPPVWLAPSRTFATFASGLFGFLFLVSAVLTLDPTLGGGGPGMFTTSTQRAAQQRFEAGRVPPAVGAPGLFPQSAPAAAPAAATAAVVPLVPQGAAAASPPKVAAPALAPRPTGAADSATSEAAKSATPSAPATRAFREPEPDRPSIGSPFLWLALTIGAALVALTFRRRMRRS